MKLWIDDMREAPSGYEWVRSVNQAKEFIEAVENAHQRHITDEIIELIDIDHDAGEYAKLGGDYIKLLDWLEETGRSYPIRIHSMNPVGVANMRRIIERNRWKEINQDIESYVMVHTPPTGEENMRRTIQRNGWEEV